MPAFNRESHLACKKALQLFANKLMPPAARKLGVFFLGEKIGKIVFVRNELRRNSLFFRYDLYQGIHQLKNAFRSCCGTAVMLNDRTLFWRNAPAHFNGGKNARNRFL